MFEFHNRNNYIQLYIFGTPTSYLMNIGNNRKSVSLQRKYMFSSKLKIEHDSTKIKSNKKMFQLLRKL